MSVELTSVSGTTISYIQKDTSVAFLNKNVYSYIMYNLLNCISLMMVQSESKHVACGRKYNV